MEKQNKIEVKIEDRKKPETFEDFNKRIFVNFNIEKVLVWKSQKEKEDLESERDNETWSFKKYDEYVEKNFRKKLLKK